MRMTEACLRAAGRWADGWNERLDRWFPERQALVRGPGHVRALRLGRRLQLGLVAAGGLAAVWLAAATIGLGIESHTAGKLGRELASLRSAYEVVADRAAADRERMAQLARDLQRQTTQVEATQAENAALRTDLASVADLIEDSHAERERVAATEDDLRSRLARALVDLHQATQRQEALGGELAATRGRLTQSEAERQRVTGLGLDADQKVAILQQSLVTAQDQVGALQKALADKQAAVEQAAAERARAIADRDQAVARAKEAASQLEVASASSSQALARLTEQTRTTIQEVERIVSSTGLDPGRLAPPRVPDHRGDRSLPRGGPFVPWANQAARSAEMQRGSEVLSFDIERLQRLRDVLRQVPLSAPLGVISVSSPFGYRVDPFNGRPAFHEGVDLQGPRGMPVSATAPGVVVFSGWRPEYGRVVEIDHGFGLRTRYAHLDQALVAVGAVVALHQEVGRLGATGRVSGAHLHYEVVVDGRVQNPLNFLKANNYVLQRD